jgi:mannose-6-phosphate isomerase-like protein (cupin superfamily)
MRKIFTAALVSISSMSIAQSKLEEKQPFKRVANAFDIVKETEVKKEKYGVFMRIPSISSGVYSLKKGENDDQTPHTKDEIYYIIKGKAKILVGAETYEVKEGSLVFVEAFKEHKFFDITSDLSVLVVFSAEQQKPEKK